jgi:hypothetical protein
MYLDILHVFHTYPKRVQDTFWDTHQIHHDNITIHVSWTLPWCHTGYMSGYIKIRVSWTLLHDTSRYIKIHMRDTYGIHCLKYLPLECIQSGTYLRCRIHAGYMRDTCICKGDQDTCGIHPKYMMRYMYLKCIQRARPFSDEFLAFWA